jgi:transposase-like protein
MYIVRIRDFCILFAFGFFTENFVVGNVERVQGKMERWSALVNEFDQRLAVAKSRGVTLCPKCFSANVVRKDSPKPEIGKLGRLKCKDCGYVYYLEKLPINVDAPARIVNQIIDLIARGLHIEDVHEHVLQTARDYGFKFSFGRTTIYDILENVGEPLRELDRFIVVGLLEGIDCDRLECDETFHNKKQQKKLREYLEGEGEVKAPRFLYLINGLSVSNRYPLTPEVAEARNKNAFTSFVLRAGQFLRGEPETISCDELKQMVSALKLRFPNGHLEIVNRTKSGKTSMGKTAHVERLNRMYRKALPKRRKVWGKSVTFRKANLLRLINIYLRKHETLGKKVVEMLGISWPNIETLSDLIFFAKFVQKNAAAVLGDEIEIFNSPILGRCVITINTPPTVYRLIKPKIAIDPWMVIGLNSWVPYSERLKLVKSLVNGDVICSAPAPSKIIFNIEAEAKLNTYIMKVVFEEDSRIHFVGDVLAGPYIFVVPLLGGGVLVLEKVWVDAGKVNHFSFDLTEEDIHKQTKHMVMDQIAGEYLSSIGYKPRRKLWKNVWFARKSHNNEVRCAKEVDVSPQDHLSRISKHIDVLKAVADYFNASHLLSLVFWTSNETLVRLKRPHNIVDAGSNARELLLASLCKVLNALMSVSFTDFHAVVEKLGVDGNKIKEYMAYISLPSFESLWGRLSCVKAPLDSNIQTYVVASS